MPDYGLHNLMVTAAHRYCLGRQTYIVSECVEWLMRIWKDLDKHTRELIVKETQEALTRDRAGDTCDIDQWDTLLDYAESYGISNNK